MSFSVRESLSVLKAMYQEASVVLALPDPPDDDAIPTILKAATRGERAAHRDHEPATAWRDPGRPRRPLGRADAAKRWRADARHRSTTAPPARRSNGPLDSEGLITRGAQPAALPERRRPVLPRIHHMPTPTEEQDG